MGVRPYQRRRRKPMIVVVSVLAVLAVLTWTAVLVTARSGTGNTACPEPADGAAIGKVLAPTALDAVTPVPAGSVSIRVFNASGQRGQANLVAAQLRELGFTGAGQPDNDPRFPTKPMHCIGQLRFGPAGEAAASTVALAMPCVELVKDGRPDPSVDVAVGTGFRDLNPSRAVKDVLTQLTTPEAGSDGSANADPNGGAAAPPPAATVDQATLQKARATTC